MRLRVRVSVFVRDRLVYPCSFMCAVACSYRLHVVKVRTLVSVCVVVSVSSHVFVRLPYLVVVVHVFVTV